MQRLLVFILLSLSVFTTDCSVVEIRNGKLLGSFNGVYHSFLSVPYAMPPIGRNRFEPPVPYTAKWSGIRNATTPSVYCVQLAFDSDSAEGAEDCLVLNIFTPDISGRRRYPVQVYLHGGAFMIGAASDTNEFYSASKNMVLVIPNYRLGALGFLSSGDQLVSGNFGLKDQQLALQWVYENIHAFGGDESRILLQGFSAGGASVHLHMLNSRSCQYFNSAWSRSGCAVDPWTAQVNPQEKFTRFVSYLNCEQGDPELVKRCLQNRTVEEIVEATKAFRVFRDNPYNIFGVVVESQDVRAPFLSVDPRILMTSGSICNVPWLVSHTERDGSYSAAEFMSYDENGRELIEILNTRWREIAPITLCYNDCCVGCSEELATQVRNAYSDYLRLTYMGRLEFSAQTYRRLEQMFTDVMFVNGVREVIDLHRKYGSAPVFYYDYRKPLIANRFAIGNSLANRSDLDFAVRCAVVNTENGALRGFFNGNYYSFLGIPYAEPPIGINRFEAPLPYITRWEGVRNASSPSVACVQFTGSASSSTSSEDCLIVDVYTPDINATELLPVRVALYGGGFMIGAARDSVEDFILRQNVVLVIPNYRVGAFGFLSSGDDLISGNWGLKDQQLALKWVQDNIQAFGGDPKKVLVSGASAGASSVHLHLLNPTSCNYMCGAMSSSGSLLNPWVFQPSPREQFTKYIRNIDCDLSEREAIKQCLQERTKEEHVAATNALKHNFNDNPFNVFGVVVESKSVPNAFITEPPRNLIANGQVCDVPWIVANSEREGSYTASEFLQVDQNGSVLIEILNERWRELAPILLFYNNSCVNCTEELAASTRDAYSDDLRTTYMNGLPFTADTYLLLEKMFTDVLFVNGIKEAIDLHSEYSNAPLYALEYRKPLVRGIGNVLSGCDQCSFGADHAADLAYVLPLGFLSQPDAETPDSRFTSENLIQMGIGLSVTGVAKYGGIELPINNATQTGKLIIYESSFEIESITESGVYTRTRYNNPT